MPSKGLCLQSPLAFAFEGPLASKCLCHRIAFAFEGPLSSEEGPLSSIKVPLHLRSKGLCHRSAFAIEGPLHSWCPCLSCHRRAFTFKVALPFHRWAVAFKVHLPLASKGLCHRTPFAVKGPLPSKGLRHRMAFGIEGPFLFSQRSTYKASIYSNRCNILRPRLACNAMILLPSRTKIRLFVSKEDACLLQSCNSHFAFGQPLPQLPSNCFRLQSAIAFASKYLCHRGAVAFAWKLVQGT
jgi:hypothetical protein